MMSNPRVASEMENLTNVCNAKRRLAAVGEATPHFEFQKFVLEKMEAMAAAIRDLARER